MQFSTLTNACCLFYYYLNRHPALLTDCNEKIKSILISIAIAALFISSKYHEIHPPEIYEIILSTEIPYLSLDIIIEIENQMTLMCFHYNFLSFDHEDKYF